MVKLRLRARRLLPNMAQRQHRQCLNMLPRPRQVVDGRPWALLRVPGLPRLLGLPRQPDRRRSLREQLPHPRRDILRVIGPISRRTPGSLLTF